MAVPGVGRRVEDKSTMTTAPGWYPDYEDPSRRRYYDGSQWTEHVHGSEPAEPAATQDTSAATPATPQKETGIAAKLASFAVIGIFAGLVLGLFLFNGIGAITPTTEMNGTVERIEIEFSRSSSSTNRRSHVLEGTTEDGTEWRIYDEDAYNVLQSEGYPQPVVVAMGDWTGTAEKVSGRSFEVDHQTTGARIGWSIMLGLIGVSSLVAAFFIGRAESGGALAAAVFLGLLAIPGVWLGYQAAQWVQSG